MRFDAHLPSIYSMLRAEEEGRTAIEVLVRDSLLEHRQYIDKHGQDMPEIRNWKWNLTHE